VRKEQVQHFSRGKKNIERDGGKNEQITDK
jgi:hypothetical protein